MDFKAIIVILITYFIRPQDWVPGMSGMNIVKPLMAWAILAMVTRNRGFTIGSLFRTPLDWMMILYGSYIVATAPDSAETFKGIFSLLAFYFVTSQALRTQRQIAIYLNCWFWCIMVVAGMAVMSEYGMDITHAKEITHMIPDRPRLVLNTYLFNNPNSLGHTVVLAIPMAYFLFIWKRGGGKILLGIACIALALYCVYLTQSKGSFIAGFAVLVGSQIVGRSRIFQIVVLSLAMTMGWAALTQLPRMTELSKARGDEAILGRLLAWEIARTSSKDYPTGEGWKKFQAMIEFEGEEVVKATHSSYVLIGAELGHYGMFFFIAVLYSGARIVVRMRPPSEADDRSRRVLVVLLFGYIVSGWMIDRSYHLEYFLMAGAIGALHRRVGTKAGAYDTDRDGDIDELGEGSEAEAEDREEESEDVADEPPYGFMRGDSTSETANASGIRLSDGPAQHLQWEGGGNPVEHAVELPRPGARQGDAGEADEAPIASMSDVDLSALASELVEEELDRIRFWRRFGIIDFAFCVALTKGVFELWDYILLNF